MLFYIYASLAAAGIIAMPSYGAWFNANHAFEYGDYGGGPVVKLGDEKKMYPYTHHSSMDWWKVDCFGEKKMGHWDDLPYPIALAILITAWPVTLSYYILKHIYLVGSKILAIPGKKFVELAANRKNDEHYLAEGKREVEKLLSTSH